MQKILKRVSSVVLAVLMCLGISVAVNAASQTVVADAAEGNYYSSITATGGSQLLGQLHDLMVSTHKTYTTYGDCSEPSYVVKTDPGSSSSYVMEFYSQADISSTWGSGAVGTWNREHVWPKSLSNGLWTNISNGGRGGGADMHHIRPAESQVNSTRGNDTFGNVSGGKTIYYQAKNAVAGYSGSGSFEPIDDVKGDVARIIMYVYMHYNKASNVGGSSSDNSYFGTLQFSSVMSPKTESDAIKLLLEWNKSDPVDDVETTRNEAVYEIQGNRNPFIDHPEYADAIWGNGTVTPNPGGDSSNNGNSGNSGNGGSGSGDSSNTSSVTVTLDSFDLTGGYGFKNWTEDELSGIAYIFGGNSYGDPTSMQFNKSQSSYYIASNVATSAPIKSVTVKSPSGQTDRDWKLLTSSAGYGEVEGKPTNGNDQGTKTVTSSGVTWTVDGEDTYFALTYEYPSSGNSAVAYIESITIEYGKDSVGDDTPVNPDPTQPDESKVAAFLNAVAAIDSDATLFERYKKLSAAIEAYQALNAAERGQVSLNDLWVFMTAIEKYNEDINSFNGAAGSAENSALHAFTR